MFCYMQAEVNPGCSTQPKSTVKSVDESSSATTPLQKPASKSSVSNYKNGSEKFPYRVNIDPSFCTLSAVINDVSVGDKQPIPAAVKWNGQRNFRLLPTLVTVDNMYDMSFKNLSSAVTARCFVDAIIRTFSTLVFSHHGTGDQRKVVPYTLHPPTL